MAEAGTKKKRSQNFSDKEEFVIWDFMETHGETMKSKLNNIVTNSRKRKLWAELNAKVSALGGCQRTPKQVKLKWKNMVATAKKEIGDYRRSQRRTGGGPLAKEPSLLSQKIWDSYKDSPSFTGFEGGIESIDMNFLLPENQIINLEAEPDVDCTGLEVDDVSEVVVDVPVAIDHVEFEVPLDFPEQQTSQLPAGEIPTADVSIATEPTAKKRVTVGQLQQEVLLEEKKRVQTEQLKLEEERKLLKELRQKCEEERELIELKSELARLKLNNLRKGNHGED